MFFHDPYQEQCNSNEGEAKARTLVLGIGNLLRRDDGAGVRVVEILQAMRLPSHVVVDEGGTGGITILQLMEGFQRVIIVDTLDAGLAPGSVVRTGIEADGLIEDDIRTSIHGAGLAAALKLADVLGGHPPVVLIGVQGQDYGWGTGLTPPVEEALPRVVEMVLAELAKGS